MQLGMCMNVRREDLFVLYISKKEDVFFFCKFINTYTCGCFIPPIDGQLFL